MGQYKRKKKLHVYFFLLYQIPVYVSFFFQLSTTCKDVWIDDWRYTFFFIGILMLLQHKQFVIFFRFFFLFIFSVRVFHVSIRLQCLSPATNLLTTIVLD